VRLLIATLAVTPLRLLFPRASFPRWLLKRRRDLGVATFGYALLHTLVYLQRKQELGLILSEAMDPSLWTGWIALAGFALLAATSNDASLRALGPWWKKLHRIVYIVAILSFAHWLLTAFDIVPGLIYAGILATIEATRIILLMRSRAQRVSSA
jgi:methionine sulfoxide reductase heme-binding subunit